MAETAAIAEGRTLLTLDTRTGLGRTPLPRHGLSDSRGHPELRERAPLSRSGIHHHHVQTPGCRIDSGPVRSSRSRPGHFGVSVVRNSGSVVLRTT